MLIKKVHIFKRARYIGLVILIVSLLIVSSARADDNSIKATSVVKFAGGIVSAYFIHEAAHALVAGATGTSMNWKGGDITQPIQFTEHTSNHTKGFAINSAGLLAQMATSEFILLNDKIDKNDSYVRGIMLINILNPLVYAADYWLIKKTNRSDGNSYTGDLKGIEFHSNKTTADIFTGTMVALVTFEAYRFVKTQSWAPKWLRNDGEPEHFNLVPLSSGGAFLTYTMTF
ncbi:MAG: hypothetical protein JW914_04320 [Syntrophaceae bacterium]|nr:hypothetical protein [Syntrophaceae bacterium]